MLVLTRTIGQSIVIDGGITIEIVDVHGSSNAPKVKLGIVAPRNVTVLRKEVRDYRTDASDDDFADREF